MATGKWNERCIRCKLCEIACPVGAIAVNPDKRVAMKCDLCSGMAEPQCVKHCQTRYQALSLVSGEKAAVVVARRKADKFVQVMRREV